jgi:hypothetical protein
MNIFDILPEYGPHDQSINVTFFRSGLEMAMCKKIICKFGEKQTNGIIVDLNEIICPTPSKNNDLLTVSVSLIIDNKIVESGLNYKFVSSLSVIDDGTLTTTTPSKSDKLITINQELILTLLFLLLKVLS